MHTPQTILIYTLAFSLAIYSTMEMSEPYYEQTYHVPESVIPSMTLAATSQLSTASIQLAGAFISGLGNPYQ
jgi:hypothetical protein